MADARWIHVGKAIEAFRRMDVCSWADKLKAGDFDAPAPPALDRGKVLAFLESAANESNVIPNHYGSGLKHAYSRTRDNVEAGAFDLAPAPPPAPAAEGEADGNEPVPRQIWRWFNGRLVTFVRDPEPETPPAAGAGEDGLREVAAALIRAWDEWLAKGDARRGIELGGAVADLRWTLKAKGGPA